MIENNSKTKDYFDVVTDYDKYLKHMNAMQLIKLILDGKLGEIYYDFCDEMDDCREDNFFDDDDDYDYYSAPNLNDYYLEDAFTFAEYCQLLFAEINYHNYSKSEFDLILEEINNCSKEKYVYQLIGIITDYHNKGKSELLPIINMSDKLIKIAKNIFNYQDENYLMK